MNAKHILGSAALAAAAVLSATAAGAEDGVWRVRTSYVVRHENVDLTTLDGRQQLLDMVEKAARRVCRTEPGRTKRLACETEAAERALAGAPAATRDAVSRARLERDESVWAQR